MKREIYKQKANKADLRNDLDRDIETFLAGGGRIVNVQAGETALESRAAPLRTPIFNEPRISRTPLDDVVATLDERRKTQSKRSPSRARKPQPKKRVIYDDFGEALRTVWSEE
jgi:hypothetical protein